MPPPFCRQIQQSIITVFEWWIYQAAGSVGCYTSSADRNIKIHQTKAEQIFLESSVTFVFPVCYVFFFSSPSLLCKPSTKNTVDSIYQSSICHVVTSSPLSIKHRDDSKLIQNIKSTLAHEYNTMIYFNFLTSPMSHLLCSHQKWTHILIIQPK